MLDKNIKARWLKALRSRKYRQGRRQLRGEDNHHCCLGVLCDVLDPHGWERDSSELMPNSGRWFHLASDRERLSPEARRLTGLQLLEENELIKMNDGYIKEGDYIKPRGFRFIASWIEKNL